MECLIDCDKMDIIDQVFQCEQQCILNTKDDYSKCPCRSKCPTGCPCTQYECQPEQTTLISTQITTTTTPATTTATTTVLTTASTTTSTTD